MRGTDHPAWIARPAAGGYFPATCGRPAALREERMNKELKAAIAPLKERITALRGHL